MNSELIKDLLQEKFIFSGGAELSFKNFLKTTHNISNLFSDDKVAYQITCYVNEYGKVILDDIETYERKTDHNVTDKIKNYLNWYIIPYFMETVYKKYRNYTIPLKETELYNVNGSQYHEHISRRWKLFATFDSSGKLIKFINELVSIIPKIKELISYNEISQHVYSPIDSQKKFKIYVRFKYYDFTNLALLVTYYHKNISFVDNWEAADLIIDRKYINIVDNKYQSSYPNNGNAIVDKRYFYVNTKKLFGTKILPKTWSANSSDIGKIKNDIPDGIYIIKQVDSSLGVGTEIHTNDTIDEYTKNYPNKNVVIQEYIKNPVLFNGKKMDFRVNYTLLPDGSVIMYKDILVRIAENKYTLNNLEKLTHVTNDLEQVRSTLNRTYLYFKGKKTNFPFDIDLNRLIKFSKKYIVPLLTEYIYKPAHTEINNNKCFQTFGIDLLITTDNKIYLIEINGNPGNDKTMILTELFFVLGLPKLHMFPTLIDDYFIRL